MSIPLTATVAHAAAVVSSPAAATLPEMDQTCALGQTDINHADQPTLMRTFNLGSPVAQRVIEARPFLTLTDLLAVNGIGPGSLASIVNAGHGCLTPTSTPPPAAEACTDSSQVDVATATRQQLMDAFGVPQPVADRIISGRPYAQLEHLRGDRVPGVGAKAQSALLKGGCLTPSPVRTATASYRYAYPAYSTTVTRGQYALTVPAGVIDSPSGAWTSITPTTPIVAPVLLPADPTADMHIWGNWVGTQPGSTTPDAVTVTLPQAPYLNELPNPQAWTPALLHQFSDGTGETLYPTVDSATGQLSTQVTSLSAISAFFAFTDAVTGALAGIRYPAPSCDGPWRQQPGTSDYQANTQQTHVTITDSQLNLPGNRPTPFGYLVKHCVQNGGPVTSAGTTFAAARTVMLDNSAAVYSVADSANDTTALLDGFGGSGLSDAAYVLTDTSNALTTLAFSSRTLWAPGDRIAIDTPAGTHGETSIQLDTTASLTRAALNLLVGRGLEQISHANLSEAATLVSALKAGAQCVAQLAPSVSASSLAGKLVAYANGTFTCFTQNNRLGFALNDTFQNYLHSNQSGALSDADLKAKGAELKGLEAKTKALKFLTLGVALSNVADLNTVAFTQSDYTADHYKPNPTTDGKGRPVQTYCLRGVGSLDPTVDQDCQDSYYSQVFTTPTGGGGTTGLEPGYIMQDSQHHSFLVTPNTTSYAPIPTAGDYVCLARAGYPVRYNISPSTLGGFTASTGPAVCPANPPTFSVTPAVMEQGSATGISLIRTETGKVYLYKGNGVLSSVLDGQQFGCWTTGTHHYSAYDYVPDSVISSQFDFHPEYVDYCVE